LRALGTFRDVESGTRSDGLGLGCHRWDDGTSWWLSDPAFDANAQHVQAKLACACQD
jgi:hypothetical protein